jgi:hypothetical protein
MDTAVPETPAPITSASTSGRLTPTACPAAACLSIRRWRCIGLPHVLAAVYDDLLAGNETRLLRQHHHDSIGDIVRLTDPLQRDAPFPSLTYLRVIEVEPPNRIIG